MQKGAFSEFLTQHLQELDDDEGKVFIFGVNRRILKWKMSHIDEWIRFFQFL